MVSYHERMIEYDTKPEDYLKIILGLGGGIQLRVNNKQIVSGLAVSLASVSEMISKLVEGTTCGTLSLSRCTSDRVA